MNSSYNHQSTDVDRSTSSKAAAGTAPTQVNAASPLLLPSPADDRRNRRESAASSSSPMSNRAMNDQKCLSALFSGPIYCGYVSGQQPQLTCEEIRDLTCSVATLMVAAAEDAAKSRDKRDRAIAVGIDEGDEYMDPPYFWPMWTSAGWTGSVDMVRMTLRCGEVC